MKIKILIVTISMAFCTILITNCIKPENKCTPPSTPIAESNSPVTLGRSINLTTPYVNGATYHWTGPDGFTSDEQNPTITRSSLLMAGSYHITINVDDCESNVGRTNVIINTPTPPCDPPNNTAYYEGFPDLSFYSVSGMPGDNYEITANSTNGDLTIEFADNSKPADGVYSICSDCPTGFLTQNEVCVSTVTSYYFVAESGDVYITSSGGKITASFCDVSFASGSTSFKFTGSAKITTE